MDVLIGTGVIIWVIIGIVSFVKDSKFGDFIFWMGAGGFAYGIIYDITEEDTLLSLIGAGAVIWIVSMVHLGNYDGGFWKLAYWLLTAAVPFGAAWKVTNGNGIGSAILTAVFIALFIVVKKLLEKRKCRAAENERQAKVAAEKAERDREVSAILEKQKTFENKYAGSPLTREIIRTISDGTGRKPEEIEIYDDRVSGRTDGVVRTFDFRANRVPFFEAAIKHSSDADIDVGFLIRPQIAMAEAINRILGGQYNIMDMAKHSAERKNFSDGDFYIQYGYISDHVIMRLKPTNKF